MKKIIFYILIALLCFGFNAQAQGTLPIYTDYLTDNVFLLHPSGAGIGNCSKLRLTHRSQWLGETNSPSLQTLSYHQKINKKAALGGVVFNDKNGYHSQKGLHLAYAYHIQFEQDNIFKQLSFGLAGSYVQNQFNQTGFTTTDPVISQIVESDSYYNADFSIAYHHEGAFTYFTVKNLLLNSQDAVNRDFSSVNMRRYLLNFGYYFGRDKSLQFEPSVVGQFIEQTGEKIIDLNVKTYKELKENQQLWAGVSYRKSVDGGKVIQDLSQITPMLGLNYNSLVLSYSYSYQLDKITLGAGGMHQITLGFNMFCKKPRATGCPNISSYY